MNPNPSGYRIASPAPSDSLPMFRTAPAAQQPLRNKNRMSKKFGLESLFVAVVGRGWSSGRPIAVPQAREIQSS
eukprot:486131-Amorphochlora_amoeboformis.AAC.2